MFRALCEVTFRSSILGFRDGVPRSPPRSLFLNFGLGNSQQFTLFLRSKACPLWSTDLGNYFFSYFLSRHQDNDIAYRLMIETSVKRGKVQKRGGLHSSSPQGGVGEAACVLSHAQLCFPSGTATNCQILFIYIISPW